MGVSDNSFVEHLFYYFPQSLAYQEKNEYFCKRIIVRPYCI